MELIHEKILNSDHCLIAGMTGAGKSVLINGFIAAASTDDGEGIPPQFILIDPKMVELWQWERMDSVLRYAADIDKIVIALEYATQEIELRYGAARKQGRRDCNDRPPIWVIIDELADLMTTAKKDVLPRLQRIGQIGRGAGVHLLLATQCPLAKVIDTSLKVNMGTIIALHSRSGQDSRNIIGHVGAEKLPRYGSAIVQDADGEHVLPVPMIDDDEIAEIAASGCRLNWKADPRYNYK